MLYDVLQCSWSVGKWKHRNGVTTTGRVHLMTFPKVWQIDKDKRSDLSISVLMTEHWNRRTATRHGTGNILRKWTHRCRLADSKHGHWQLQAVLTHHACHIFTRPPSRPCGDPPVTDPVKNCNAAAIRDTAGRAAPSGSSLHHHVQFRVPSTQRICVSCELLPYAALNGTVLYPRRWVEGRISRATARGAKTLLKHLTVWRWYIQFPHAKGRFIPNLYTRPQK